VDHIPDTSTGFSATIFRNIHTGARTLAIRGTQPKSLEDIVNDINILAEDGVATAQLIDLYNFWLRANTASGKEYTAARLQILGGGCGGDVAGGAGNEHAGGGRGEVLRRRIDKGIQMPMKRGVRHVVAVAAMVAVVTGCIGYVPGRQTYWDAEISEKCRAEGAVQIIESVVLTSEEASRLPRVNGKFATRPNTKDALGDPVYSERTITVLRERNPKVTKEEVTIIRRSDGKTVAHWVEYARVGGGIPTGRWARLLTGRWWN
jgi:hypothetical protein